MYYNLGYSAQYFVWKNLYAEAGIDLVLSRNNAASQNYFFIRPGLGIGWQTGRWAEQAEVAEGERKGEDYSVPVTAPPRAQHLLAIGWAPMVPLFGIERQGGYYDEGDETLHGAYDTIGVFNPLGVNLTYVYIPYLWRNNRLGFGIDFSILGHKNRKEADDEFLRKLDLLSHVLLGIYYQRDIAADWQIGFNAGIGITNPYDYINDFTGPPLAFNAGVGIQYFFYKNFYAGFALNYVFFVNRNDRYENVFTADDVYYTYVSTNNDPAGILRPTLSVGVQFNRNRETGLRLPGTGLPAIGGGNNE